MPFRCELYPHNQACVHALFTYLREALTARFIVKGIPEPQGVRRVEIQALTLFHFITYLSPTRRAQRQDQVFMNPVQLLGKSTEWMVLSMLLAENREVYMPAVDDHGVDLIVRTLAYNPGAASTDPSHYEFQEIQVKSLSTGGLFAAIKCVPRPNYWFVFYIKDINRLWLVNSMDFCRLASRNSKGANIGKYSFDLKPTTRTAIKHPQFLTTDFAKLP